MTNQYPQGMVYGNETDSCIAHDTTDFAQGCMENEHFLCFIFLSRMLPGAGPVLGKRQVHTGRCYDKFK